MGLKASEAADRLAADGANDLIARPRVKAWRLALGQLRSPLVYLLAVAAAVACAAWVVEGAVGLPVDALVIVVVVLVNALLSWLQENKAQNAVAALSRMTESTSGVMRDSRELRVPSASLVRGDVLVLREGDAVGADGRLFEASALTMLESSLTGESESVFKHAGSLDAPAALGDRLNMVFKGTSVAKGGGRAIVTATGMQTEVGAVATMLDATKESPTPLQREVKHIGGVLGLAAVLIAATVVATILLMGRIKAPDEVIQVLLLGVSLAVAAVPEGLPAILSVVLALGVQQMARRHAIVKSLASVETLGSASIIATDKTGTLTRAEMTITRIAAYSGLCEVTGVGYAPVGSLQQAGKVLGAGALLDEAVVVLGVGSLAGNAGLLEAAPGNWVIHGEPTEASFLVAQRKLGTAAYRDERFARVGEIPFTSDRKMMSTVVADHDRGGKKILMTKGAPGALMARCTRVRVGNADITLDDVTRQRLLADVDKLADLALRTLAVAYRPLDDHENPAAEASAEQRLVYAGSVGISDPPRAEAAVAIQEARGAGIRVLMITGDHPRTAVRIAIDLGIVSLGASVLTGAGIDALDDQALALALKTTSIFARVEPRHKLRIVQSLQAAGEVVAMTGDGVNDAPALKASDIGVAMGVTGTEVSKEASRMILADDDFATIVQAVRVGRGVLDNIRKFLRYLLSSNLGEVLTVFLGIVGAGVIGLEAGTHGGGADLVLPLLATQILWINLITDSGPALAMSVDPAADDLMRRKPRQREAHLVDGPMWINVVGTGLSMAIVTLLTMDCLLPGGLIEGNEDLPVARTAGFTVLVLAQLFNCFNARSGRMSAFRHMFSNRWLWATIVMSVLLQIAVVHISFLNRAFSTVPLSPFQWLICLAMASLVLWISEMRKLIQRSTAHRPNGMMV